MPKNPARKSQGGDVEGTTKTDVMFGEPVTVSNASFDGGYDVGVVGEIMPNSAKLLGKKLKADLLRGYCDYGRCIGEHADAFDLWDEE